MNFELDEDFVNAITVRSLKNMLVNTYLYRFHHAEDLENNMRVREACKELLRYCMIAVEAEDFFNAVEREYGSTNPKGK